VHGEQAFTSQICLTVVNGGKYKLLLNVTAEYQSEDYQMCLNYQIVQIITSKMLLDNILYIRSLRKNILCKEN
jgi:hypothetical protein